MEQLINKIRKLQAKAEGTNNEAEAAAFAGKVQQLLLEHSLSMADIAVEEVPDLDTEDMNANRTGKAWRRHLAHNVGQYYMCQMWYDTGVGNQGRFMITGKPHNRAVAISMYEYLIKTVKRLAVDHARKVGKEWLEAKAEYDELAAEIEIKGFDMGERPNLKQIRADFDKGCCMGLSNRLLTLHYEMTRRKKTKQDPDNKLPALYKNEHELAVNFAFEKHGLGSMGESRMTSGGNAASAGRRASDKIRLSSQVTGRSTGALLT